MTGKNLFIFLLFSATLLCSSAEQSKMARLQRLKETESEIALYGKIVDQFGEPISDVRVPYEISSYGFIAPNYTYGNATSDENGLFEIHHARGGMLYLKSMEKKGYDGRLGGNNTDTFEFRTSRRDRHHPSKDRPVVFHLRRKMSEAVALIKRGLAIDMQNDMEDNWCAWDFIYLGRGTPKNRESPEHYWDIKATGELNEEKREWTVTFRMNGGNAGMQFLDEFLYEAPAEGYKRELAMTFSFAEGRPGAQQLPKYMYLRLRDPGVYARMLVEKVSVSGNGFKLSFSGVINPYGTRSLEPLLLIEKHQRQVPLRNVLSMLCLQRKLLFARTVFPRSPTSSNG